MRRVFSFFILIIYFGSKLCYGQEPNVKIDSLISILKSSKIDTLECDVLVLLSKEYLKHGETGLSISTAKKAFELSKKVNHIKGAINSSYVLGNTYFDLGDNSESTKYYLISAEYSEKLGDRQGLAKAFQNLGSVFMLINYEKAIFYYEKALVIYIELGDNFWITTELGQIAYAYELLDEYDIAIGKYKKIVAICQETGDTLTKAYYLNRIGFAFFEIREYKKAHQYFSETLEIYIEQNDTNGIADCKNGLAEVNIVEHEFSKAEKHLQETLKLLEVFNNANKTSFVWHLIRLSEFYILQDNFEKANGYLKKSLNITEEYGGKNRNITMVSLYELLYKVNLGKMNYKEALNYHVLYSKLNDSIINESNIYEITKVEAQHAYETQKTYDDLERNKQKALDNAENDKLVAIEKEGKEKQQIITFTAAVGLGLVVIFLFFVFIQLKSTRKQKDKIASQKLEVESQRDIAYHQTLILEEKNYEILESITYAKRIQEAILPPPRIVKEYLKESFILYKPKDIVAGDFYWMEHTKGKVLFASADCTGHGVPGAMVSVVCNNALNRSVREYKLVEPGEILDKTREIVIQEFEKSEEDVKDGMDVALCSLEGNTLKYAGAHNPLWIIRKEEVLETKANKQPIGKFDKQAPYTTHTFELEKGDSIYIFSDGYVDQFGGEKGKKFKSKAFRTLLLSIQDKTMEEQKIVIDETFQTWKGKLEQIDDVCVIGVRI